MENQVLVYKYGKNGRRVYPAHDIVKNWLFDEDTEEEALLAHYMAAVGAKSGITANDLQHLFPAVLRMLKNKTVWAQIS